MNTLPKLGFSHRETPKRSRLGALHAGLLAFAFMASAQTPPPAPTLVEPAAGVSLIQPITLGWNAVVDPDGPIGNYLWQIGTSSTFSAIVAEGFQNMLGDDIPTPTHGTVSGLPNGTYFWRVRATQMVGGAVFSIDSPWSQVRSFTVTGLGPAPGRPTFTFPANGAAFHPVEFFDIKWTSVPGANYYLLEADDEPSFSPPLTLSTDLMQFGTKFNAGWGNVIPNIYYRVVAVSADNVRGLPSATLNVHVIDAAPVPPPPTPLSPVGGATLSLPAVFDWSDTANPQIVGYDLDIDDDPNFDGVFGVVLVQQISRSDYMLAEDPDLRLAPGTYFWRVRAIHGNTFGPWSAGARFNVVAPAPTPPNQELFWLINEPGSVSGGNPTQARVTLNMPAGPGGAMVKIASDLPHVQSPTNVFIPEGKTDGWVAPITTVPVGGTTVGTLRAAYARNWQQNSIALWPILWGLSLSDERVIGGELSTGTLTLQNPAPPGGIEVTIVSSDTSRVAVPAKVFIPAGGTGAAFSISTSPVSVPTRVVINSGTAFEGYRAPENALVLLPAGSPAPAPSLASLSLASARVASGSTTTGTVRLTDPAPPGGAAVLLSGSMEGEVVTPSGVTVPAGSLSANFTIKAPQVNATHYVFIQGRYGTSGGTQAALLEIDPGPPGAPTLLAMAVKPGQEIGGNSLLGTVGLVTPAPVGGGVVNLSSDNPAAQVPATVMIAAGNSADSFTITTSPVLVSTPVRIDASAGGVTKSYFIYLGPDPNAPPLLQSITLATSSVAGGTSVSGTVFLSSPAPAGGTLVTLATSSSAAQAPGVVNVPAAQSSANFTVTTSPVSANTQVTVTAFVGSTSRSASFTVTPGSAPPATPGTPSLVSPANGATVAQPITLDWNNTSGAATYEIQVDDSSNFSVPLVQSLTSTASQTTVSGLSAVPHWWRVRGRNSAGVAGNWSSTRSFTPQAAPAPANLSAVSVNPPSVVGGNASQGTVTLTTGAPSGGAVVTLSSSNPGIAAVPVTVTVGAGAANATFAVTTTTVAANTSVILTATYNGVSRTTSLTVTPPPPPPPSASLSSITLNPATVTGGTSSQGTVTLTSAAPAGGAVVALSSSRTSTANVPASVTVIAGASTANFTITSSTVTVSTAVTVTATYNAVQRTAAMTVNPAPVGPLPAPSLSSPGNDTRFQFGQLITFDWSDVSGAAGYTFQIDDRDNFPAPLILTQTTTTSSFASSSLARADMWWRVRANDAGGNPGAWSAARRFRVE